VQWVPPDDFFRSKAVASAPAMDMIAAPKTAGTADLLGQDDTSILASTFA